MKGLMIKVGAKVAGDLISSSSLFSFTRGNGLGADNRSSLVPVSHLEPGGPLPFKADKLLEGHRDSTHSSLPSSPSDSTLSLQLDGKQFIGLLQHGNALLWSPHWNPDALGQGILAIKLERLCKFPQHMVMYWGLSPAKNRTSVKMNCITRRFLLGFFWHEPVQPIPRICSHWAIKSIGAQQKIRLGILPPRVLNLSFH